MSFYLEKHTNVLYVFFKRFKSAFFEDCACANMLYYGLWLFLFLTYSTYHDNVIAIETNADIPENKRLAWTQIESEQLQYTVWMSIIFDQIPIGYTNNRIWTDSLNVAI